MKKTNLRQMLAVAGGLAIAMPALTACDPCSAKEEAEDAVEAACCAADEAGEAVCAAKEAGETEAACAAAKAEDAANCAACAASCAAEKIGGCCAAE